MSSSGLPIPATDDHDHAERPDRVEHLQRVCTNCLATESDLSRCGRCKRSAYCSKECQVKHWPMHKPWCKKVEESDVHTDTVVREALACPLFNAVLQACYILHFLRVLTRGLP
ncbi:hypothetical protein C8R46DRAFT_1034310 [Mycena filopes]|nr:hypothetical protein C8R46DRAFT_1034310 [Mycena filopes]